VWYNKDSRGNKTQIKRIKGVTIMSNKERLIDFILNLTTEQADYIIACLNKNNYLK
jgi:hypothetical protein